MIAAFWQWLSRPSERRLRFERALQAISGADRCADALAALVEPLTPTSGQLVAWLESRGWTVEIGGPTTWGQMRRGGVWLSIPMLEGARDRERCVRRLFDDVAHVEGIRRSRVVVDLWAAMLAP